MAGWSSFRNDGCSYIDVDVKVYDECEDRLRNLFDQALLCFLKEEFNRPLPAVLGDGESIDLFKLFVLVKERGGFDSVSRNCLWGSVAKQLGLECGVSPSVRLIYTKYLDRIEKWAMEESKIVKWDDEECEMAQIHGCYGAMLHELGDGLKGLLKDGPSQKHRKQNGVPDIGKSGDGSELKLPNSRKRRRSSRNDEKTRARDVEETSCLVLDDDALLLNSEDAETSLCLDTEKQEGLSEMVKWLTWVAKCPRDPTVGVIPDRSKWKEHTGNEYWIQVIRAKEALLVQRRNAESRTQNSLLQGHQTMHPSMFEDDHQTERLRCSIRRLYVSKTRSCSCCNETPVSQTKPGCSNNREPNNAPKTKTLERREPVAGTPETAALQASNAMTRPFQGEISRRHVSVGPLFQAQVPEWSDPVSDSDPKWLGTRVWPLEGEGTDDTLRDDSVGKGRPDSCRCGLPGSVECVRFHVAENRMELKRELGPVFFIWRFNDMGEEVSLRWTEREERRFKELVRSDSHCFWENALKCFRRKTRQQLVSYYFNVFLINRRRYQNRVAPRNVDSDDDEYNFGCVGYSFGHEAISILGSDIMICSQNNQCSDLD